MLLNGKGEGFPSRQNAVEGEILIGFHVFVDFTVYVRGRVVNPLARGGKGIHAAFLRRKGDGHGVRLARFHAEGVEAGPQVKRIVRPHLRGDGEGIPRIQVLKGIWPYRIPFGAILRDLFIHEAAARNGDVAGRIDVPEVRITAVADTHRDFAGEPDAEPVFAAVEIDAGVGIGSEDKQLVDLALARLAAVRDRKRTAGFEEVKSHVFV